MNGGSSRQLGDNLDLLAKRLEHLHQERTLNLDQSSRAVASLDKMAEVLVELERLRTRELVVAEKFSVINGKLEGIIGGNRGKSKTTALVDVLKTVAGGAKVTGQVIEIVAGGFQGVLDSINKLFNSESTAGGNAGGKGAAGGLPGIDLSSILQPMNTIVQTLVSQKSKESGHGISAGAGEEKDFRPQDGGVQPDDEIKAPIVKATPAL
jgi:hypothetical protein